MDSKKAPVRAQSGGTKVSRRTVTRGVAWSAPIAAVGVAAPAFAASCTPQITLDPTSCKCPGQSEKDQPWVYFLKFCLTDANSCGATSGAVFTVTQVVSNSGVVLNGDGGTNCGYPDLDPDIGGVVGGACTTTVRLVSTNSAHFLDVSFTIAGQTGTFVTRIPAPPDCADVPGQGTKCTTCP